MHMWLYFDFVASAVKKHWSRHFPPPLLICPEKDWNSPSCPVRPVHFQSRSQSSREIVANQRVRYTINSNSTKGLGNLRVVELLVAVASCELPKLKGWGHNRLMSNVGLFFFFFRICLNFCMWASF